MESLFDILNVSVPFWVLLPFAILSLISQVLVFSWLMRQARKPASAANNALTRAIRKWLGVPRVISMSESELEALGGIDKVKLGDEGDILIAYRD